MISHIQRVLHFVTYNIKALRENMLALRICQQYNGGSIIDLLFKLHVGGLLGTTIEVAKLEMVIINYCIETLGIGLYID